MAHAERCPLCKGSGKYEEDYGDKKELFDCHGCDGKGWITVQDQDIYSPRIVNANPNSPLQTYIERKPYQV